MLLMKVGLCMRFLLICQEYGDLLSQCSLDFIPNNRYAIGGSPMFDFERINGVVMNFLLRSTHHCMTLLQINSVGF